MLGSLRRQSVKRDKGKGFAGSKKDKPKEF